MIYRCVSSSSTLLVQTHVCTTGFLSINPHLTKQLPVIAAPIAVPAPPT
jgi:hypothetical protein